VPVDPARFKRLDSSKLDLKHLIGERTEVVQEPGPVRPFASLAAAGDAAGLRPRAPSRLPSGVTADSVWVSGEGPARIQVDGARLRELMQTLDVHGIDLPPGLDGRTVEVHVYPAVQQVFRSVSGSGSARRAMLLQARSPEVSMPEGVDLTRLA